MPVRDGRGDVKQTTAGFRGPLMVQSLTSAKSKFLSLIPSPLNSSQSQPQSQHRPPNKTQFLIDFSVAT